MSASRWTRRGPIVAAGLALAAIGFGFAGASTGAAAGGTRSVKVADFEYKPKRITVPKGTKIRWKNLDAANHTVTFDNGRKGLDNLRKASAGADSMGTLTFNKPGTYKYTCAFHPSMHGTVVVKRR